MAGGSISPVGAGNVPNVAPKPAPAPTPAAAPTTQAAAPEATTSLSPNAAQTRVDLAYEHWNSSIGSGVNHEDPHAREAARGLLTSSLQATQAQADEAKAAGKPYDMDAGLAANMVNGSRQTLLGGENSPDPNAQSTKTLTEMGATALNYLQAREAQLKADTAGTQPPPN